MHASTVATSEQSFDSLSFSVHTHCLHEVG